MVDASIILPTYNERQTILQAISGVQDALQQIEHEILVVDDNSPDDTAEIVQTRHDTPRVRVLVRHDESGLSSAVLHGMTHARGDIYAVMDADLQHPPRNILALIKHIDNGADIAVGSRHLETGDVADDWPLHRRLISHTATLLAWTAVPPARQLSDPMSGFFAIRGDLVDATREQLHPRGYKILLELVARCPHEDIVEHGYTFQERADGGSNLGPRQYLQYMSHLARLTIPARRHSPTRDPLPDPREARE